MGRQIAVPDHEKPSGRRNFDPKKYVRGHLIRTLSKLIRRTYHGAECTVLI